MIFNEKIGIIYDTIFYFRIYFNEDEVLKYCYSTIKDPSEELSYYNQIKSQVPDLPIHLSTFVYSTRINYSFLFNLYGNYLNWHTDDFGDFLKLFDDKAFIKRKYIENFFPEVIEEQYKILIGQGDRKEFYNLLSSLNLPVEFNYLFRYTLDLFDDVIDELVYWLKRVHTVVSRIHSEQRFKLVHFVKNTNDKTIKRIAAFLGVDEYIIATGIVGISLFYPVMLVYRKNNHYSFLFGLKIEESMDFADNYNHVSIHSASKMLADPTKVKMLELFFSQDSYTIPDIIKHMHLAKSTVVHHISKMVQEKMIVLEGVKNRAFRYKINHAYFEKLLYVTQEYKDRALGMKK